MAMRKLTTKLFKDARDKLIEFGSREPVEQDAVNFILAHNSHYGLERLKADSKWINRELKKRKSNLE
jgi:hypothetical protein